jgi:hypothetical protein
MGRYMVVSAFFALVIVLVLSPSLAQNSPLKQQTADVNKVLDAYQHSPQVSPRPRFLNKAAETIETNRRTNDVEAIAILDRETGIEYVCFRSRSGEGSSFWCDRTGRNWKE